MFFGYVGLLVCLSDREHDYLLGNEKNRMKCVSSQKTIHQNLGMIWITIRIWIAIWIVRGDL